MMLSHDKNSVASQLCALLSCHDSVLSGTLGSLLLFQAQCGRAIPPHWPRSEISIMGTADSSWGPGRLRKSSAELTSRRGALSVNVRPTEVRADLKGILLMESWGVESARWPSH